MPGALDPAGRRKVSLVRFDPRASFSNEYQEYENRLQGFVLPFWR